MSSINTDHLTDMDGNAMEALPERCRARSAARAQLIAERWINAARGRTELDGRQE